MCINFPFFFSYKCSWTFLIAITVVFALLMKLGTFANFTQNLN